MPTIYPISRSFKITADRNGDIAEFGPPAAASNVGTWGFTWVPDASFVGSLSVVARPSGDTAKTNAVGLVAFPYQPIVVNGVVAVAPYAYDDAAITGYSMFQVPSAGFSIGFLIDCTDGFGWLYSQDLNGTAPAP